MLETFFNFKLNGFFLHFSKESDYFFYSFYVNPCKLKFMVETRETIELPFLFTPTFIRYICQM